MHNCKTIFTGGHTLLTVADALMDERLQLYFKVLLSYVIIAKIVLAMTELGTKVIVVVCHRIPYRRLQN